LQWEDHLTQGHCRRYCYRNRLLLLLLHLQLRMQWQRMLLLCLILRRLWLLPA
jgi:hypothetical protein